MAVYQYNDRLNTVLGLSVRTKFVPQDPPNVYVTDYGWTNDWRPGFRLDPLFNDLQIEVPFQGLDGYYLLGWRPVNTGIVIQEGNAPDELSYDSTEDWRYFGSFMSGFFPGRLADGIASIEAKEGLVNHTNASGSLSTVGGSQDIYPGRGIGNTILGNVPRIQEAGDNADFRSLRVSSVGGGYTFIPDYYSPTGGVVSQNRYRFEELLFHLKRLAGSDQWSNDYKIVGSYNYSLVNYCGLDYSYERVGSDMAIITITYQFRNRCYGYLNHPVQRFANASCEHVYSVRHEVVHSLRNHDSMPPVIGPGSKPIWMGAVTSTSRTTYTLLKESGTLVPRTYPWFTGSEVARSTWSSSTAHIAYTNEVGSTFKSPSWDRFWHNLPGYHPAGRSRLDRFGHDCDYIYSTDLRGIASISAGKAFEKFKSSSNWFESAPEITEILSFLPAIAQVGRTAEKIANGDLSVVPGLIKDLANAYLAFKFGLAPSIEDAKEVHRLATNAIKLLGSESLLGNNILHGSHTIEIPREFSAPIGEGTLKCVAVSKVVLRGSLGVNMVRYLQLLATGFGPTSSNFLATVPFSFVATWFTGLEYKAQNLDNNLGLALLPVHYYVHSVRLDYRLTPWELQREGLTSRDGLQLRRFIRRVSFHHPVPRDGRFDLLPPPQSLQFAAALGALVVVTLG